LRSLSLDYVPSLDDQCVRLLCHGLLGNRTLTSLSLSYGGFGPGAMPSVARLLSAPSCGLANLKLKGNFLGAGGLAAFTPGLVAARSLEALDLSCCGLGRPVFTKSSSDMLSRKAEAQKAWEAFVHLGLRENLYGPEPEPDPTWVPPPAAPTKKKAPKAPTAPPPKARLKKLVLMENNLLPEQGEALAEALREWDPGSWPEPVWDVKSAPPCWILPSVKGACPLEALLVDITLPDDLFVGLWRNGAGGGGKKGKKGKKKK
jgi:hypothetical protein